jgi:FkbM family methyltransferase
LKAAIKRALKYFVDASVVLMGTTSAGRYLFEQIVGNTMGRDLTVEHRGTRLKFAVPNGLNRYRAVTFATKEPETLEWIDRIPEKSVVWDIGANVGLYSCYAAKARGCRVFAFEPSVFNLEILARNIFLNQLTDSITIVPLALSDRLAFSTLNMSSTDWGGSLSTFGESYGHDGATLSKVFEFSTVGLSMVDSVSLLQIPRPDYIKMDVDGIEHLILKGGLPILRDIREASIEINDDFTTQAMEAKKCLEAAGLRFKEKRHAEELDLKPGPARSTFNQIWVNPLKSSTRIDGACGS